MKRTGAIECRSKATESSKEFYITYRFKGIINLLKAVFVIYYKRHVNKTIIHWDKPATKP